MGILERALNIGEGKKFKEYEKRVARINAFEPELELESDDELRERFDALRERAQSGDVARRPAARGLRARPRGRPAHDGHAPLRRAADRRHGPPRRQHRRDEDRRGQDADRDARRRRSTALAGKGVHVVTVNDYLARRDAEWMSPIYDVPRPDRRRPAEHAALRGQAAPPTPATSPTARTPSSASTTCATTWPRRSRRRSSTAGASTRTAGRSPRTPSRSSTRSTTSSSTRRARR